MTNTRLRRDRVITAMTIEQPGLAQIISKPNHHPFHFTLAHIRQKLLNVFLEPDNHKPDNNSQSDPVLAALLLGSYQGISPATRELFLTSGTMHYLSLSGLHVATITGFLWLALKLFNLPRWLQGILPALFVIAYLLIVPARPDTVWTIPLAGIPQAKPLLIYEKTSSYQKERLAI